MKVSHILKGDALTILKRLDTESVDCVVTSPPYWALRDYGTPGQLGLENDFTEYITKLCDIFDEVKRVLKPTGTCFVNIGDTYSTVRWSNNAGTSGRRNRGETPVVEKSKKLLDKCLVQIPSRFAIEMCNRGWILRNELIWYKPNAMPQSVKDRFTVDFEKVFFFVKSKKYNFTQQMEKAIWANDRRKNEGRVHYGTGKRVGQKGTGQENFVSIKQEKNMRSVWKVSTTPFKGAHFAVFPEALISPMIKAGCPEGGAVLDPFFGAGTTGVVAKKQGKRYIGIEINEEYIAIAKKRLL